MSVPIVGMKAIRQNEYEEKMDNIQEAIDNIDYAMSALELTF